MANVIKIKRSSTTATPSSLAEGELGFSELSNNLFIGTNGGADVTHIGGKVGVTIQAYNADTVIDGSYVHTDNNYTTTEKSKLAGIEAGAEVNVNADWQSDSGDSEILNKPYIPQVVVDFDPVGTDNSTNVTLAGSYDYLTLSGQQITLGQVDYSTDISNTPYIPTSGTDFDPVGTDNSTDVTLVTTSHDYLSITGQAITLGTIDISDDTNLAVGTGLALSGDTIQAASGYAIPTTTSQDNWDTVYAWYQEMIATDDVDSVIDTWAELVAALNNAGESVNILNNGSTIDGGSF